VYIFVFLFLTSLVGVAKALYTYELSISLIWNLFNTIVFGYFVFVAMAEARSLKRAQAVPKKIVIKQFPTQHITPEGELA